MIKVSVEDGDEEAAVAIAEVCRTSTMICTNSKALDGMSKLMPLKTIRYDIYIYIQSNGIIESMTNDENREGKMIQLRTTIIIIKIGVQMPQNVL